MKKTLRLLALILVFIMLAAFTDVPQNANLKFGWAYPYVNNASQSGLMIGDGDGNFRPGDYTSKEESAIIIYRILNYGTAAMTPAERSFTEEEKALLDKCQISDWARLYLVDGFKSGFWTESDFEKRTDSVPAGKQPLERQMVATWLIKAEGIKTSAVSTVPFSDFSSISVNLLKYIDACYRTGLMIGDDENKFHPLDGVNRAEMAVILTRALKLAQDSAETAAKADFYGILSNGKTNGLFAVKNGSQTSNIYVEPNSKILIDGAVSDMAGLKALAGKTVTISTIIGTNVVIAQTKPKIMSAKITAIENRKNYDIITVDLSGTAVSFIKNQETNCSKKLEAGTSIKFISDGSNLLEIN